MGNQAHMTQAQALDILNMLRDGVMDMVTVGNTDWIYNPNMGGGEWEAYEHDGDHTEYAPVTDIYQASEMMIATD